MHVAAGVKVLDTFGNVACQVDSQRPREVDTFVRQQLLETSPVDVLEKKDGMDWFECRNGLVLNLFF